MAELILLIFMLWIGLPIAFYLALASLACVLGGTEIALMGCEALFMKIVGSVTTINKRYEAPTKAVRTNRLLCRKKDRA